MSVNTKTNKVTNTVDTVKVSNMSLTQAKKIVKDYKLLDEDSKISHYTAYKLEIDTARKIIVASEKKEVDTVKVSKDVKATITKVINAHKAQVKANDTLNNVSMNLFNIVVKESIAMKKDIVVSDTVKDINEYKLNKISKALKDIKEDTYYHSVVTIAIKYLKSGYTVTYLDKVKLATIKKLLDCKPSKASVKATKDNTELESLINKTIASDKTANQKLAQAKLSDDTKAFLKGLSDEQRVALKQYFMI